MVFPHVLNNLNGNMITDDVTRNSPGSTSQTSSYPGWIKSPHVVTCHTCQDLLNFNFVGGGGIPKLKSHKVPRSA